MDAWSNLPSAYHINWVLKSVTKNPQLWAKAWNDCPSKGRNIAYDTVLKACAWSWSQRCGAKDMAWHAVKKTAWNATAHALENKALPHTVHSAAGYAIATLVTYDNCDQYIDMGYEKLSVYYTLSEKPQVLLLLPMVYVREKLNVRMVTLT